MEQFYSGMMILNQGKEESYFALEIGLPTIGEEIVLRRRAQKQKLSAGKAGQRLVCQRQN